MNPNYIKERIRVIGKHNKHEKSNSHLGWANKKGSTFKAKPNEIGLHLLIAMWFKFKPNIGA
jgi:hypothetical protein